ncbi:MULTISPECIES: fimbrial protein [Providencia]|uniref:Type 1 fimbrial protein n=1 Tax=Providencia rettgeri TaxID=587 RepID=A0A3R8W9I7_PRORE|nr:fimbrial protein [Providencia rettgeri]ELR5075375.1 type 1 fimbrial protein [Providencia stuartii]ELR5069005.1 type 1 fimbrial protein [Providencia rettgeri]ELR5219098.1 type 1 fimbrial protein [Providencia rettgeri]ELR5221220.1 type 1 fimbrial protein [Providencia rettgeri]MBV2188078.1 type 1 fimbrial protein [Providencia rettgeri]
MTNALTLMLSIIFVLFVNSNSLASSLSIYFEGNLLPLRCHLSSNDVKKTILLSQLRFSELEKHGQSDVYPFKLDIVNCAEMHLNKTVRITLNAKNIETYNGITYLKPTGESTVLLALINGKTHQPLTFNTPIDIGTITESGEGSINTMLFGIYAQKPFNSPLIAGGFSSLVTFNLDYQ